MDTPPTSPIAWAVGIALAVVCVTDWLLYLWGINMPPDVEAALEAIIITVIQVVKKPRS